ncbi:hypothetical protein ABB37_09888 [Leptomonas pyrrhocoris]|uniref:Uncharacterized protein n=1 Tax=Leptomonas pyrrhocoris TaxID=157538 RepID=A0A0N0DQT4_LEPPY|nr:hypothetical protein ABB37_09888 [Leptomonas pyrrhocoris]KPA73448.1 hypothetical protein ABB37_09888 [Leptomonas pyrrhocoris]|eukprot:XP_015651887.1 hypothetical protein ABB37_09888 [Leptomonas pyrrhocoris]
MSASATVSAGAAKAPPHAPGERFRCRVDVEDICVSVEGNAASSTTALFWEEARVACRFNGGTQRTRWIALQPAMDEVKRELQAAAPGGDLTGAAAPQTGGLLALPYTALNTMSYEVEFTAAAPDDPAVASVTTVKSKRFHTMEFAVEAQNLHRVYSAVGGATGDRAPTSGNMEVISASLNKKAAKVSAWTRSVFSKLGSGIGGSGGSGERKDESGARQRHHHSSLKEQNEAAVANMSDHPVASVPAPGVGDTTVHEGIYATVVKSIDVSEAYNRPGGRQYYCLVVKPESRKLPEAGVGTPIAVSFSVVVHYGHSASVPRSFHNFAIVVDQFVLDYSEAARVLPPDPKSDDAEPRPITGYAFGYTANTAANPNAMEVVSRPVPVAPTDAAGGGGEAALRVVDFDRLHNEVDERKRTPADYRALPTSCCVVSGSTGSQPANRPRLGNRVVCVSRFKTSPDGLCKPSFKCQFVVSLVRFYGASDQSVRESAAPINLAALMNQEILPQRIRTVRFELGEMMYLRLRRFSFAEPEVLRAPLLLPYDYNNEDVQLPAPPAQQQQDAQDSDVHQSTSAAKRSDAPPPLQQQQQQPANAERTAAAPAPPTTASREVPAAAASSSSASSDAAPASPLEQRSGSDDDDDASTPRAGVQHEPTAPMFTLEPQEDASALQFGPSTTATATRYTGAQPTSAPAYDPVVAAATVWGVHGAADDGKAAPAVELTPTASNPFFSAQHRETADAAGMSRGATATSQHDGNPYNFGAAEGDDAATSPKPYAAFELTPLE